MTVTGQILFTDRLAVEPGVAGDRRDRPTTLGQGMYFHIVLPCEHEKAGLLRAVLQASDTSSIEEGPPFSAEPHGWGISMSVSGEFQGARSSRESSR